MARKQYNQRIFKPTRTITIEAWTEDTSYGFRHLVRLLFNKHGNEYTWQTKACYYNRTWEQYEYESVIHKVIDNSNIRNKKATIKKIDDIALHRIRREFNTIGTVMALGNVLSDTPIQANDWKLRMLKAGIPQDAISLPDGWDALSETEKTRRLDAIIAEFTK